ncbi:MAG: hypothetical protein MUO26_00385 [Methanotrichaceae archaeon]|nr:hypothetical protein [Methanotrichaceae archaeon]
MQMLMQPRTEEQLKEIFDLLVAKATKKFGKRPLVDLEESDVEWEEIDTLEGYERANLYFHIVVKTEEHEVGKNGILTERTRSGFGVGITEDEIPYVCELLRAYDQPDPDFEGEVERGYWG